MPLLKLRPRHEPHACAYHCPDGQPCCCTNRHQHVYHICSDPACECHSRRRYDGYDSGSFLVAHSRTQRAALTHLGMLDLRSLMASVRGRR